MQSGYVEALWIQRQKGLPFENVNSIELKAGKGIVGDYHIGEEKQIALLSSETKHWVSSQEIEGLCFARFNENILITGIDFAKLKQGDFLITNQVKIEILSYTKRCFSECNRIQSKLPCELKLGICFAKVVQSGNMQIGDRIWKDTSC